MRRPLCIFWLATLRSLFHSLTFAADDDAKKDELFATMDTNKDGKISKEEFAKLGRNAGKFGKRKKDEWSSRSSVPNRPYHPFLPDYPDIRPIHPHPETFPFLRNQNLLYVSSMA